MKTFSPNALKTFLDCQKKYELKYIQKISFPQKSSLFDKGKKIHALANYYLTGADLTKLEKALSTEELELWQSLKSNAFFNKNFVKSEYNITFKLEGFWLSGRLDALMKDEKTFYILDYKTGSAPKNAEFDFQTMIYLLASNEKFQILENDLNIEFIYIDLKNNENISIKLTKELKTEYEKRVLETLNKIKEEKFKMNNSSCKFCEFKNYCNP